MARQMRPVGGSDNATSVKVPPMKAFHVRAACTQSCGFGHVQRSVLHDDAIVFPGGFFADEATSDVLEHLLGRAVERMPAPATAAGLNAQNVPFAQDVAVGN